jgi:hypothetical protein
MTKLTRDVPPVPKAFVVPDMSDFRTQAHIAAVMLLKGTTKQQMEALDFFAIKGDEVGPSKKLDEIFERTDFIAHVDPAPTGTEANVCADIARRQAMGTKKYGVTVAMNPLPLRAWLNHAYEETLDQAIYLKRAMEEMDAMDSKDQEGWL